MLVIKDGLVEGENCINTGAVKLETTLGVVEYSQLITEILQTLCNNTLHQSANTGRYSDGAVVSGIGVVSFGLRKGGDEVYIP